MIRYRSDLIGYHLQLWAAMSNIRYPLDSLKFSQHTSIGEMAQKVSRAVDQEIVC